MDEIKTEPIINICTDKDGNEFKTTIPTIAYESPEYGEEEKRIIFDKENK